jgi:NAD(P)-dependent dehydrogenase (short-subunit alcohol dehydrogenase family)
MLLLFFSTKLLKITKYPIFDAHINKEIMTKLKNKVAVITGGNSGIGFGIAEAFKNEGAVGAIVGRNETTLNLAIDSLGDSFIGLKGNVNNLEDLENVFKTTADKFGKIDALVVNAGGVVDGVPLMSVTDATEEGYDSYMDLNLKSVYFTVNKALPYLNDGASIILIASNNAHRATPGTTIYAAAKAAVISLARGLSLDLLSRRIRVNTISPGSINTPVFAKLVPEDLIEQVKQIWIDLTPLGRQGIPSEIGKTAVFLASEDSSFIIGTDILADGGMANAFLVK